MTKPQQTQEAFSLIQQLASLAATPGISADNITLANTSIENILKKVVTPAVNDFTASVAGLIVK